MTAQALETRTYDQMDLVATVTDEMLVGVQEPEGPVEVAPVSLLASAVLERLKAADGARRIGVKRALAGSVLLTLEQAFEQQVYSVMNCIPDDYHDAIYAFDWPNIPVLTGYIQVALNVMSARGGVCDFPAGGFKASLIIPDNVTLRGAGAGGVVGWLFVTVNSNVRTIIRAVGTSWVVRQLPGAAAGGMIGIDVLGNGAAANEGGILFEGDRYALRDFHCNNFANQGLVHYGFAGVVDNFLIVNCVLDRNRAAMIGAAEYRGNDGHISNWEVTPSVTRAEGDNGIITKDVILSPTATITAGSKALTVMSSTVGLAVGDRVTGAGVPVGAQVMLVDAPSNIIYLDVPCTASAAAVALTVKRHNLFICAYLYAGYNAQTSQGLGEIAERGIHSIHFSNRFTATRADRNYGPGWSGAYTLDSSCISYDNSQGGDGLYDGFEATLPGAFGGGARAISTGVPLYGQSNYHRYGANVAVAAELSAIGLRPNFENFVSIGHKRAVFLDSIYVTSALSGQRQVFIGVVTATIDWEHVSMVVPTNSAAQAVVVTTHKNLIPNMRYTIKGNPNVTLQAGVYLEPKAPGNIVCANRKSYSFTALPEFLGEPYLGEN